MLYISTLSQVCLWSGNSRFNKCAVPKIPVIFFSFKQLTQRTQSPSLQDCPPNNSRCRKFHKIALLLTYNFYIKYISYFCLFGFAASCPKTLFFLLNNLFSLTLNYSILSANPKVPADRSIYLFNPFINSNSEKFSGVYEHMTCGMVALLSSDKGNSCKIINDIIFYPSRVPCCMMYLTAGNC